MVVNERLFSEQNIRLLVNELSDGRGYLEICLAVSYDDSYNPVEYYWVVVRIVIGNGHIDIYIPPRSDGIMLEHSLQVLWG